MSNSNSNSNSKDTGKYLKFGSAIVVVLLSLGYLAYTGVQESKSYYVTIKELHGMGDDAFSKRLRVAGNVEPGSIQRDGTNLKFILIENDQKLPVIYTGSEAAPDTFKDDSQAMAAGKFGHDGVFHANEIQAKCASKYAPQQQGTPAMGAPSNAPAKSVTQLQSGSSGAGN
jgi:cytochrome c-type biogenesis protein CcmE